MIRVLGRRLARVQGPHDQGMTLVEILIATMLLTMVIGLATGSLVVALDRQTNVSRATAAITSNQTGMELMTRLLRQAVYPNGSSSSGPIITTATASQIVFTSRLSSTGSALAGNTAPVQQYT